MNYQVFEPSAELRSFVKCYWTLDDEAGEGQSHRRQRVVPDGCMEMIFHYGDLYRQVFDDGSSLLQPRSFIFGQITRFIEIEPTGISGIVAARFLPEGLMPLLPVAVSAIENKATSLEEIYGEKGIAIEKQVLAADNNAQRIKLIDSFLLSLLRGSTNTDEIVRDCVQLMFHSRGQLAMAQLATENNVHRRQMERKFMNAVGISPKQLSKLVRLQHALKMLEQRKTNSLTDLAHRAGYYDQAHFIKDFKEFTGVSPKEFFAANLKMSALFVAAG